jgi:replicative superfamily II helicase
MSMLSELEDMRQENTQYAIYHINKNPDLYELYIGLRDSKKNAKTN